MCILKKYIFLHSIPCDELFRAKINTEVIFAVTHAYFLLNLNKKGVVSEGKHDEKNLHCNNWTGSSAA